ncbi:PREDICTED: Werner syndrome ATP-dependent helicase homolog [Priapulus caudatus]|uniref:3'-5' exonuclease n=1 Tax=Priapulus caudatus TaxID=37621 RepID=A0ABM1EEH5_PRICU|nr:PREDICTED: Werner syndrome ATP-dependent helicase homolog [Priapulus caudatus]
MSKNVSSETAARKRKLPSWLIAGYQNDEANPRSFACLQKQQEAKLPFLKFPGNIIYSHNESDCNSLCENIRQEVERLPEARPAGVDIEWPVSYNRGQQDKTAVLQICTSLDTCFVFHLSCMQGLSTELRKLLDCDKLIKVGLGIHGDLWKLERDFDLSAKRIIESSTTDLTTFANTVLNSAENWSLDRLSQHVLKRRLVKDSDVRMSDWRGFPLSSTQLSYAAIDAYASLLIYLELQKMEKSNGSH